MSDTHVDVSWLLTASIRIAAIVLTGFLLAHLFAVSVDALGVELLYGVEDTLVTVLEYTTLLTALLYTISTGVPTLPRAVSTTDTQTHQ
ncbi:hypothetical protein [Salarchaeum japonicum]|uniref:Uncharacterized protein n=1 Tax=Salarchaeum japonicum TaxID=555573 RepID=A0AAV3T211_9EURY|nr:hypothetical protein [Salarchaeum japonicum]